MDWKDDTGATHTHLILNILYFPNSPMNILSVTKFTNHLGDNDGAGITTIHQESQLFWDPNQYCRTIVHLTSNIPEMSINDGFKLSSFWTWIVGQNVCPLKQHCHCSFLTNHPDKDHNATSMDTSSLLSDVVKSLFHVGKTLLHSKDRHSRFAKVINIDLDGSGQMKICIRTTARRSRLQGRPCKIQITPTFLIYQAPSLNCKSLHRN